MSGFFSFYSEGGRAMAERVAIFIDGSNFYHAMQDGFASLVKCNEL